MEGSPRKASWKPLVLMKALAGAGESDLASNLNPVLVIAL